jgi:hypothetical protein
MIPEATQCLKLAASTYNTKTTREACSVACLLIMIYQHRKKSGKEACSKAINITKRGGLSKSPYRQSSNIEEFSWLEALIADLPGLQMVDLDQYLGADLIDILSGLIA